MIKMKVAVFNESPDQIIVSTMLQWVEGNAPVIGGDRAGRVDKHGFISEGLAHVEGSHHYLKCNIVNENYTFFSICCNLTTNT